MSSPASLKPTDKAIKDYYAALQTFAAHAATHEGATETAFSRLLAVTAKPHGWTLIPKKGFKSKATGKHIAPDGTLEDDYYLPRGYWEAKDTDDDLEAEVKKKVARGYPLTNTVFEDMVPGDSHTTNRPFFAWSNGLIHVDSSVFACAASPERSLTRLVNIRLIKGRQTV